MLCKYLKFGGFLISSLEFRYFFPPNHFFFTTKTWGVKHSSQKVATKTTPIQVECCPPAILVPQLEASLESSARSPVYSLLYGTKVNIILTSITSFLTTRSSSIFSTNRRSTVLQCPIYSRQLLFRLAEQFLGQPLWVLVCLEFCCTVDTNKTYCSSVSIWVLLQFDILSFNNLCF